MAFRKDELNRIWLDPDSRATPLKGKFNVDTGINEKINEHHSAFLRIDSEITELNMTPNNLTNYLKNVLMNNQSIYWSFGGKPTKELYTRVNTILCELSCASDQTRELIIPGYAHASDRHTSVPNPAKDDE